MRDASASQVLRLLEARPDLAQPPPADRAELRRRADAPSSLRRAVADLPTAARQLLDAVVLLPGCSDEQLADLASPRPTPAAVAAAREELEVRLLLAPGADTVDPAVARHVRSPGRFGRSLVELHAGSPAWAVRDLLESLGLPVGRTRAEGLALLDAHLGEPEGAQRVLGRLRPELLDRLRVLDAEGPVVRVPGLDPGRDAVPDPALRVLTRAGLVVLRGGPYVEVPREVALGLRHPHPLPLDLDPPEPPGAAPADASSAAAAGAAAAHGCVAALERLAEAVDAGPLPLLASGGVGVRDLRRLGAAAGLDVADTATLLELAEVLGLLKLMSKEVRLTKEWDAFAATDVLDRWSRLARGWTALAVAPYPRAGRARPALGSYGDHERAALRGRLLAVLRGHPDAAPPAVWAFRYGRRWYAEPAEVFAGGAPVDAALVEALLGEAALLGLVAAGAATPLLALTADALRGLDDVGEQRVRAQADGTLVCTGTPCRSLRADLDALAGVESRGAATVWRLSEVSLATAYGAGWTPARARAALLRWAGELPQAMSYLVDDAARRAGRLTTGAASSYLVAQDEAALADALTALRGVGLTRVAPTVAVSAAAPDVLAAALASAGLAAAGQVSTGRSAAKGKRAALDRTRPPLPAPPPTPQELRALAEALASGPAGAR